MTLIFSGNLVFNIFRGPIELAMGITFGVLVGVMCWWFPNKKEVSTAKTIDCIALFMEDIYRSLCLTNHLVILCCAKKRVGHM
jgi:hypothetical protein